MFTLLLPSKYTLYLSVKASERIAHLDVWEQHRRDHRFGYNATIESETSRQLAHRPARSLGPYRTYDRLLGSSSQSRLDARRSTGSIPWNGHPLASLFVFRYNRRITEMPTVAATSSRL